VRADYVDQVSDEELIEAAVNDMLSRTPARDDAVDRREAAGRQVQKLSEAAVHTSKLPCTENRIMMAPYGVVPEEFMTTVMRHARRMLSLLCVLTFAAGCTTEIYAPTAQNPPPSRRFHEFGKFRLEPVALSPAYAKHGYNLSATAAIDRNLRASLVPDMTVWGKG
jgi:hypothetical protein